ncbi:hypothetical protein [Rhodococcus sp. OK302]|uniref:hypothetical protein n=1 Tax=Rhodococcus sp. OK302 TaxID=1882769 RepID=UPI000B93D6FD|nr:hypothetical protein [Rhodococcus sp. OK302]
MHDTVAIVVASEANTGDGTVTHTAEVPHRANLETSQLPNGHSVAVTGGFVLGSAARIPASGPNRLREVAENSQDVTDAGRAAGSENHCYASRSLPRIGRK